MLSENRNLQADELIKSTTQKINVKSDNIKDWNKAIQFVFTDASPYWIKITNGKGEAVEKTNRKQKASVTVTCTVETLQRIVEGNSVQALVTRKVKVDGPVLINRELRRKVLGDFNY